MIKMFKSKFLNPHNLQPFTEFNIFKKTLHRPVTVTLVLEAQVFSLPAVVVGRGEDFFVLNVTFV